jgi:hypothetical protein
MADAVLVIGANTKEVQDALKKAGVSVDNVGKKVKGQESVLKKFKANWLAVTAAIGGIALVTKKVIMTASDFEEANAKFGIVFKDNSEKANAMRKELVQSYGLSTLAVTKMMGSMQDFLVPMGIVRKEATGMSGEFLKLSRDLASFNKEPTEDVLNAMKSALTGISMPMKRFGVDVSETGLKQQLLNEGITKSIKDLSRAEKAQLIYRKMVADSSDAIGDFKRTNDSFANTLVQIKSITEDASLIIGQTLLEAIRPVVQEMGKLVKTEEGMIILKKAIMGTQLALEILWATSLKPILEALKLMLIPLIEPIKAVIKNWDILTGKGHTLGERMKALKGIGIDTWDGIKNTTSKALEDIKGDYTGLVDKTIELFKKGEKAAIAGIDNIVKSNKDSTKSWEDEAGKKLKITEDLAKSMKTASDTFFTFIGTKLQDQKLTWALVWKTIGAGMIEALGAAISRQLAVMAAAEWAKAIPTGGASIPGAIALTAAATAVTGLAKTLSREVMALGEGGSFIVPPGFEDDSFPIRVKSGERVDVTPAGESPEGYVFNFYDSPMTIQANNPQQFGDQMLDFAMATGSRISRR